MLPSGNTTDPAVHGSVSIYAALRFAVLLTDRVSADVPTVRGSAVSLTGSVSAGLADRVSAAVGIPTTISGTGSAMGSTPLVEPIRTTLLTSP